MRIFIGVKGACGGSSDATFISRLGSPVKLLYPSRQFRVLFGSLTCLERNDLRVLVSYLLLLLNQTRSRHLEELQRPRHLSHISGLNGTLLGMVSSCDANNSLMVNVTCVCGINQLFHLFRESAWLATSADDIQRGKESPRCP